MYKDNKLRGKIRENGLTLEEFAKAIGISYGQLNRRMSGDVEWERIDIQKTTVALELTPADVTAIFFADDSANA